MRKTSLQQEKRCLICLATALVLESLIPGAAVSAPGRVGADDSVALVQQFQFHEEGRSPSESVSSSKNNVYHLHIPRTAGTSFAYDVNRVVNEEIVSKEGCYDWRFDLPGVNRVAVMLRSPREHVLSQYLFCTEGHVAFMTQVPRPNAFKDWVDHWAELQEKQEVVGDFAPDAGSVAREERFQTLVTFTKLPFHCYNPTNLQGQHLTCVRPFTFPREVDAEQAITNMQEAWFVGLVEAYQESLCLLYAKAAGRLPGFCNCKDKASWESFRPAHTSYHSHHTWTSHNVTQHPKEVLQTVDKLTTVDRLLYKAAVQRFVFEVREVEREHKTRILCYDTALVQHSLQDPLRMHFGMYMREAGVHLT